MSRYKLMLVAYIHLLALSIYCAVPLTAQSAPQKQSAPQNTTEKLKMVVVLSRHGVRSPTWTQERLNNYSSQPWPKWSVVPGNLTERGYKLVEYFGSYDRTLLARNGLLSSSGCADVGQTYIWADTDQRTVASGRALAEGLFPGCNLTTHSLASGQTDALFHPTAIGVSPAQADAAYAGLSAAVAQTMVANQSDLLSEMQNVLQGCAPRAACTPAHLPQTPLLGPATVVARGKGDHVVDLQGPLPQASTFAEDFLLEYADGMPMEHIGWGNVDAPQLRRFLALHSEYFGLVHRTPAVARLEASNMLSHIERTLQQHVSGQLLPEAIGPPNEKLVVLAGHDTNLAGVAALLGLRWKLDGRDDDTPPGTELAFELWQNTKGEYSVRVTIAMQTLQQMREMQSLTSEDPPVSQTLSTLSWQQFRDAVEGVVDQNAVYPLQVK